MLHTPLVRVLVVEDSTPVRRLICSELQQNPELLLVGEACDGLEAIQRAQDLQPDLVLVDIGLPKLNGLEAARRIRRVAPQAKLLFASMETSPDIVRESLRLGGHGYVCKLRMPTDLLPAIESVLEGRLFVSVDLARGEDLKISSRHDVLFYYDDTGFLEGASRFIAAAMKTGNPAIVVATASHRESLIQRLKEMSFDMEAAMRRRTFVSLDAGDMFSSLTVNGVADRNRIHEDFGRLIEIAAAAAAVQPSRVAIFGEGGALLCAEGQTHTALLMEKIENDLIKRHNVDILCAYPLTDVHREAVDDTFTGICAEHSAILSR